MRFPNQRAGNGPLYAASAAALMALATAGPALAVTVTIDGQPVGFNPPPITRAGRVFVPLRGVFERLGATVVYQAGVINATGGGRTVSLQIGSQDATVSGQPQTLDVAPFIIGASTYVPLRFVSQALGATVNFDAANQVVALSTNAGPPVAAGPPAPSPTPARILRNWTPARDAYVGSTQPTIQATFIAPVDPNTLRIVVDGLDVSNASTRSTSGFIYAPPSPLQSMRHEVDVSGGLQSGGTFAEHWRFTSGSVAPANRISILSPADGDSVPQSFLLSGRTVPNARIHVVAGATATLGGVFTFGAGTYTGDTTADDRGNFTQQVSLQTVSGASIGIAVLSTDPVTKEAAEKKLRLRAQ